VRKIVLKAMLGMLKDAAVESGGDYDESAARALVDAKLKLAYYEQSYKAVLDWASEIGIEFS
jgi:ATP-dependent protease HslVU (ClpYQ) peptidase subunit